MSATPNKKPTEKFTVELDSRVVSLLRVLSDTGNVKEVLLSLADHAQQGVYRKGAWERVWLSQAFGDDWLKKLVPGDPYGRPGCESVFQKPKEVA
jgi:hypothetical protein